MSSNTTLLPLLALNMNMSNAIHRDASEGTQFENSIAKIIVVTTLPFFLLVAFEAIVVNGSKMLINTVILLVNTGHGYLFPNPQALGNTATQASALSPALISPPSLNPPRISPTRSK